MYSSGLMESSNVVVVTEGGTQSLSWYTREKSRPDSGRAPSGKREGGRGMDGVSLIAGRGLARTALMSACPFRFAKSDPNKKTRRVENTSEPPTDIKQSVVAFDR